MLYNYYRSLNGEAVTEEELLQFLSDMDALKHLPGEVEKLKREMELLAKQMKVAIPHSLFYFRSVAYQYLQLYKSGQMQESSPASAASSSTFYDNISVDQQQEIAQLATGLQTSPLELSGQFDQMLLSGGRKYTYLNRAALMTVLRSASEDLRILHTDIYTGRVEIPENVAPLKAVFDLFDRTNFREIAPSGYVVDI